MLAKPGSRGADAVALTLKRAGVKRVFALSGNHIMVVFDALHEAGIDIVHTRHEAAAVHMADAWAAGAHRSIVQAGEKPLKKLAHVLIVAKHSKSMHGARRQ